MPLDVQQAQKEILEAAEEEKTRWMIALFTMILLTSHTWLSFLIRASIAVAGVEVIFYLFPPVLKQSG